MEAGIRVKWGNIVEGREKEAIDLFAEAVTYFGTKMGEGAVTFFEPFFVRTSDQEQETGFMIVKGSAPSIFAIMEDPAYLTLVSKAYYLLHHFEVDMLMVGEGITMQLERSAKARAELGIS